MSVVSPAFNSTATEMSATSGAKTVTAADSSLQAAAPAAAGSTVMSEGDTPLPEKVAYVPETRPQAAAFPTVAVPAGSTAIAGSTPQPLVQQAQTAEQTQTVAQQVAAGDAAAIASKAQATTQAMSNGVYVTASEPAQPQIAAPKKSFFASLFSTTPASAAPAPLINNGRSGDQITAQATQVKTTPPPAKPIVTLASATPGDKPVQLASIDNPANHITGADALPGVRQTALFEIKRKSGIDDESDVDLNEDEGGGYQVASAAGMARLAPNGLLKQNESVDVACLKPSLVRVLKTIEGHFGRKMIVTSGYRDPSRNRRANGAKNSLHMYCAAADIQVPGVSKWELANYVRSMPGRGGVGTYCHTESVHVDVGPERDWNWRCRRRGGGEDG
ncbi:YcbK family protein [Mesorhizobium sp. WSM4935]|uniref:YcbK family protein n=1 Tax=Mesorhizobium sp. WSM4935 TaxID=3038547 RepID=UPI0024150BB1|nr:YcbK family protein [Mesorhizobium sp. WSM4935]MDG4874365.1 YcbK family protein [Mesorhizobium sp. WSM4935]